MGTFNVTIGIGGIEGHKSEEVEALVDTGATTTVAPASLLRRVGIEPTMTREFEYADGRKVELELGQAIVRYEDRYAPTLVIFGEEGSGALLGAITMQALFLGVDTHNERLIPVTGILKTTLHFGHFPWPATRL